MNKTTCLIPLTQGQNAIVSAEDYDFLMQWKWSACKGRKTWYAIRGIHRMNKGIHFQQRFYMHREVAIHAKLPWAKEYDHKDRNGLNNARDNLRSCTRSQNHANTTKQAGCSSLYKGVSWHKSTGKWRAKICVRGRQLYLGLFSDEVDAHHAYAAAAVQLFGEFANPDNC